MEKEPFDNMPQFTIDKDDVESFQRTRAQANKNTGTKETEQSESSTPSKSPSWFMFLFLLTAVVAGGAYWSSEQYKVLQQAQARISDLENRLSATGEEMGQSTVALGVQVKELSAKTQELWDQMDKLWASAWRRNQADIKTIEKSLADAKRSSSSAISSLEDTSSSNETAVGLVKEQLTTQTSIIKQLQTQLAQANSGDADIEQQLASLREKLISTALANNNLTNRIDDLDKRLKTTEKSVQQSSASSTTPSPP